MPRLTFPRCVAWHSLGREVGDEKAPKDGARLCGPATGLGIQARKGRGGAVGFRVLPRTTGEFPHHQRARLAVGHTTFPCSAVRVGSAPQLRAGLCTTLERHGSAYRGSALGPAALPSEASSTVPLFRGGD